MGDNGERRYPQRRRKPVDKEYSITTSSTTRRWSNDEKLALVSGLHKYGDQDVNILANTVESKAAPHVYSYLMKHKAAIAEQTGDQSESDGRKAGLRAWIKYLKGKKQKYPSPSPTALSMLMISLLEDHPVPTDGEVSFPEAYEYLFRLLTQRHDNNFSKLSPPTKKFIQLSILSLIKDATKDIDKLHETFVQSANVQQSHESDGRSDLPPHVQYFLRHNHFNPLALSRLAMDPDASSEK